jgi:hypothetical protein
MDSVRKSESERELNADNQNDIKILRGAMTKISDEVNNLSITAINS